MTAPESDPMADDLRSHFLQRAFEGGEQDLIVKLLQRCIEQNERILIEHETLKASLVAHTLNEESLVAGFAAAFPKRPDGKPDFEGHEVYHSALITESRERALFLRGLRYKLLENGFWGLITVLGLLVAYRWSGQIRGLH